jgi:hypothetical protein
MGAVIFLVLFGLGVMLSTIGGLIGLVDAFRVSPTWGLLAFFVPFALLFFCIKFWGSRKWAKISLITTLAGLLSMLAGGPFLIGSLRQQMANAGGAMGDASPGQPPIDQIPIDQQPIDQVPVDQVPVDQVPVEGGDPNFSTPMVPAAPQLASNLAGAELIQSTDPEERIRQINNRRTDPFATVPVPPPPVVVPPPPVPTSPTAATPTAATPTAATPTVAGTPSPTAATPRASAPNAPRPGGGTAASPGSPSRPAAQPGGGTASQPAGPGGQPSTSSPGEIALAPLPALPEPTEAQAVVVTGVVTIGNRNYAIVQSPDEPTGRYVAAGQRVAGGAVLVKRIDMRGNEPVVVLEQNGVEVSHSVGLREEEQETAAAT